MKKNAKLVKSFTYTLALTGSLFLLSCTKENSQASEGTTGITALTETSSASEERSQDDSAPMASMEETAQKFAELNCKSQEIALKMQKQGTQDLTQLTNDQNEIAAKLAEVEDDAKYYEKQDKDGFEKLVAKHMGDCKH